jgi:hypothetical protein
MIDKAIIINKLLGIRVINRAAERDPQTREGCAVIR